MEIFIFAQLSFNNIYIGRTRFLAEAMARKGHSIIFLNHLLHNYDRLSYPRRDLDSKYDWRILWKNTDSIIRGIPAPPLVPSFGNRLSFVKRANGGIKRLWYSFFIRYFKKEGYYSVAFISSPVWADITRYFQFDFVCYDCMDDISVFSGNSEHNSYLTLHKKIVNHADAIIYSANKIGEDLATIAPLTPRLYIPNGVDSYDFERQKGAIRTPQDMSVIPKPVIGYVGGFFPWINVELLYQVAKILNGYSFVFIGITANELKNEILALKTLKNVYFLGPKPFREIPSYINSFDVCLIPFLNNAVSDRTNPVKLYEYFYFGKPVVSTGLPELKEVDHLVYFADQPDLFSGSIVKSIQEDNEIKQKKRIEYALNNTWDKRAEDLLNYLRKGLRQKIINNDE